MVVIDRGEISSLCALKIFSILYLIGALLEVTKSQQQPFVINLVCFLKTEKLCQIWNIYSEMAHNAQNIFVLPKKMLSK